MAKVKIPPAIVVIGVAKEQQLLSNIPKTKLTQIITQDKTRVERWHIRPHIARRLVFRTRTVLCTCIFDVETENFTHLIPNGPFWFKLFAIPRKV